MPRLKLLFIDAGGKLYRGFGTARPLVVWHPLEAQWRIVARPEKPEGWAQRVTPAEAERCYPGSTSIPLPEGIEERREFTVPEYIELQPELFDGYDGRITRHSPEEDARSEAEVRRWIADRKAEGENGN